MIGGESVPGGVRVLKPQTMSGANLLLVDKIFVTKSARSQ